MDCWLISRDVIIAHLHNLCSFTNEQGPSYLKIGVKGWTGDIAISHPGLHCYLERENRSANPKDQIEDLILAVPDGAISHNEL